MEEMAAEYVDAIRSVQPHGPFLLGGWSLGGVVAFAMAQQLIADNEEVHLLAMLDTTIPHSKVNEAYTSEFENSGLEYDLELTLEELAELPSEEQLPYLFEHARKLGVIDEHVSSDLVERLLHELKRLFHAHVALATTYALKPYPGRIVIFRPEDAPVKVPGPADRGWGQLADDVDVHFVPGQHHTMVKPGHAAVLADKLQQYLPAACAV
jgi:thioesterase domain-containing protein